MTFRGKTTRHRVCLCAWTEIGKSFASWSIEKGFKFFFKGNLLEEMIEETHNAGLANSIIIIGRCGPCLVGSDIDLSADYEAGPSQGPARRRGEEGKTNPKEQSGSWEERGANHPMRGSLIIGVCIIKRCRVTKMHGANEARLGSSLETADGT